MDINDDADLIKKATDHIDLHHSIDLRGFLSRYAKEYASGREFAAALNRIRHAILRNSKYKESSQLESQGREHRIMINPNKSLEESVIATNASITHLNEVVLPDNFRSQERFSNKSLLLALFSTLFILATIVIEILDTTPQQLRDIKKELQNQDNTLKDIQISIEKTNASIEKLRIDSLSVRVKK